MKNGGQKMACRSIDGSGRRALRRTVDVKLDRRLKAQTARAGVGQAEIVSGVFVFLKNRERALSANASVWGGLVAHPWLVLAWWLGRRERLVNSKFRHQRPPTHFKNAHREPAHCKPSTAQNV